jgi:hypothetical protein
MGIKAKRGKFKLIYKTEDSSQLKIKTVYQTKTVLII